MTPGISSDKDKELARAALRRGAPTGGSIPRCGCFDEGGPTYFNRRCKGICEDAVDWVAAAIAKARADGVSEDK